MTISLPRYVGPDHDLSRWSNNFAGMLERILNGGSQSGVFAVPAGPVPNGSDLQGNYPAPTILKISNDTVPTAPVAGAYLIWVDPTTHDLKVMGPNGTITTLATP